MLSKATKTRGIPRTAIKRVSGDASRSAVANGAAAPGDSPPDAFAAPPGGGELPGPGHARRPASRRALKNWRLRSRLWLLVIIPTVTAVAAGGVFIASSVDSALVYGRVLTLANLGGKITGLVQALQSEREDTVRFIVLGPSDGGRGASPSSATPPAAELSLLNQDYAVTTGWASQVKALANGINGSYGALTQQDAQAAITAIGNLPAIRAAATGTHSLLPALNVIDEYATAIDSLLAVESQVAVGVSDSTLTGEVRVLGLVSSMKEEASQQQALLTSALRSDLVSLGQFGPDLQSAITDAQAQQQGDLNEFDTVATPAQRQLFNNALSTSNVAQAQAQEQEAISLASSKSPIATDPTVSDASSSLSYVVSGMRSVEEQFANSVISRSGSLHDSAITSAVIFSLGVALLLGIALTATIVVGRSMVGPLRRLRNGALQVAEERLPEMVRQMSETDGEGVSFAVEPIDVDSSDEIGEVARAFDQVHREAVRLAANEAALRGNVNGMFVNLSRRSQSLVERQLRVITRLERGEEDSERLEILFLLDHLATRMRRNSENLLVLAGQELSKRWSRPVVLMDVLRAAASEIEQYERVTLNVQPEVSVRREAVSDLVHLVAELVENATSYSAAGTPVTIGAHLLRTGGVLIDITDQGVGMAAEDLATANWRLDNPPTVDVGVSRRMGLFVVARLALRHGIRVRLNSVRSGGLTALVWLPDEVITREKTGSGPLRSVSTATGNRPVAAPPADRLSVDTGETGPVTSRRGFGRYADVTRDIAPTPRPAPLSERLEGADPGPHPLVDNPGQDAEHWAAARPLRRVGGQLRPTGLGAGSGPRGAGTGQGDGDQRNEARFAAARGVLSGAEPGQGESTSPGGVLVPQEEGLARHERLPIYDAVESDWFRRGGPAVGNLSQASGGWSSPADDGFRAAEAVHAPTSDGITSVGLPKRVPRANLVPGSAAASAASGVAGEPASEMSPPAEPGRSAEENRDRFAGFQRGIRLGRAAATGGNPASGSGTNS